jgi:hypothetical protein
MTWTGEEDFTIITGEVSSSDEPRSRPHTSFSQLSLYQRCSLAFHFKYVKSTEGRPSLAMLNGSAGHQALEWYARRKKKTLEDQPESDLLDVFSDSYDLHTSELSPTDLQPGESIGDQKDATAAAMREYRRKHAAASQPLVVEWEFNLELPASEDYETPLKVINGRIDIAEAVKLPPKRRDAPAPIKIRIKDYKFASRTKSQDTVDLSHQLSLYDLAATNLWGTPPDELGFQVFIPATTRTPARVETILRSPHEMEPAQRQRRRDRLVHSFRTTQRAIDAGIFQPTDDPRVCSRCEYRPQCQYTLVKSDLDAIAIQAKEGAR